MYTRALKKPPSGSGAKKRSRYLLENMNFLKPYVNINLAKSLPGNLPSPRHTEDSEVFGEHIFEFNDSVINNDIQNNTNDDGNTSGNGANIINEQFSKNPKGSPKKKKKHKLTLTSLKSITSGRNQITGLMKMVQKNLFC